jgi:hypothetical protein
MSRDLDSRFSEREKAATEEWLRSNKGGFHLHLLVLTLVCHFYSRMTIVVESTF